MGVALDYLDDVDNAMSVLDKALELDR